MAKPHSTLVCRVSPGDSRAAKDARTAKARGTSPASLSLGDAFDDIAGVLAELAGISSRSAGRLAVTRDAAVRGEAAQKQAVKAKHSTADIRKCA